MYFLKEERTVVNKTKVIRILLFFCGVFTKGPEDLGLIPGRVIPKTQQRVLDPTLLNTQHYKVKLKCKVEQSRERSSALP